MSRIKSWKQTVKENPALVIGIANGAALALLGGIVVRNVFDTRLALTTSNTALKIILGEIKIK